MTIFGVDFIWTVSWSIETKDTSYIVLRKHEFHGPGRADLRLHVVVATMMVNFAYVVKIAVPFP